MNLQRLILLKLENVSPRMLTETVLWADVRLEDGKVSLTELRGAIRQLEEKSQVVVVPTEDATRIKITADGIARLAQQ